MDMPEVLFLIAIPLIVLAWALFQRKRKKAAQMESTCGTGECHTALAMVHSNWFIGPRLRGFNDGRTIKEENRSPGMDEHPLPNPGGGFFMDLPVGWEKGHANYVTFCHGPLTNKQRIIIRGRLELSDGAKLINDTGGEGGWLTPYFQRRDDNWTANGEYETYRWWASFAATRLENGDFEIVADLNDPNWTATQVSRSGYDNPDFDKAKDNAACVGFTLGGGTGYGHGVAATGPARLIVTEFVVE
jgi:hypothetical protein